MAFIFVQGSICCDIWSLTLWVTFWYTCPWFVVLGSNFSNLPQCPNYTKASVTWPSDGIYMWVRLHLMWNVEFCILDDFLCIWAHYLGYLGSISPTWPNAQKYTKSGRTQPSDGLYPWTRLHLMWNVGFNPLDDSLRISAHDLGYLGQIFRTYPNTCKYTKTGNWPSDGLITFE